jgi:diacylglycerol kinase (ATP)
MTDPRASFIVNPAAGGGRKGAEALIGDVKAAHPGADIQFAVTERAGHATFLARELASAGYDPIVAVGGDGTVHEVANGLLEYSGSIPTLGVIPVGTGNDFARSVGIPTRFAEAVAVAVGGAGVARAIDAARCNDRYFIGVAGAGLDARVASAVNGAPRWMKLGAMPFVWYALREIVRKRSVELVIELDRDTVRRQRSLLVSVSNCRFSGGGMQFSPDAEPDDGLLDVCIVGNASRIDLVRLLPRVFSGGHVGHPAVELQRAARVTISGPADVMAQSDGELIGGLPLVISVVPRALRVLVAR